VASARLAAYGHLLRAQMRSQAQYRASFAIDVAGSVAFGILDVVTVVALFRVSRTLAGFTFAEVFLMTALASSAFALADLAVGNVERLRFYVRTGLFDAVLVRPLGALMQLLAMDVAARRVGRVAIGVALLGIAAAHADLVLTPARLALLVVAPVAGALIFSALFVATATVTLSRPRLKSRYRTPAINDAVRRVGDGEHSIFFKEFNTQSIVEQSHARIVSCLRKRQL
jgi:ABC-2 type transport system permease protein